MPRHRPFTTATVGFPRNPRHISRVLPAHQGQRVALVRDRLPRA